MKVSRSSLLLLQLLFWQNQTLSFQIAPSTAGSFRLNRFNQKTASKGRQSCFQKEQQQQQKPSSLYSSFKDDGPSVATDQKDKQQSVEDEVKVDAESALANVGWSMPTEGELTSNDPFVQAIDAGIQRDMGVPLEELLNPAKVVNLERDLFNLRVQLAQVTGREQVLQDMSSSSAASSEALTTEACDGGGGGETADDLRKSIAKKEADLLIERRSVFRGWLKNIFLGQAVLSFALSYVMATEPSLLFGGFGWFSNMYNMDISIRVLGYWWWWLFIIPSLRSRRPKGPEKEALDIAFLASPAISLIAPVATKDTGIIWAANFAIVSASYAYAFLLRGDDNDDSDGNSKNTPEWLKFVFKSLDFGTGRERGARN